MLTLLTAGVIAAGGVRLAREVKVERLDRDRSELNAFADALQEELRRLEHRYTIYLSELTESAGEVSNIELVERAEAIWGVQQVSLLRLEGPEKFHLAVPGSGPARDLPVPSIDESDEPFDRDAFMLDAERVRGVFPGASGWMAKQGEPLLFWRRPLVDRSEVVVVLIDKAEVAERIDTWLMDWLTDSFSGIRERQEPDALFGPNGVMAKSGAIPQRPAEQVQSLRTRFGHWQVRSWDGQRTVISYDRRVIKVATALALLVALAGGVTFFKLRKALRLAAQRVSFVNQVSHELRTPLTNILLNADLAADGATPTAQRRLNLVRDEAGRLRRLIDNVLTFSKLRRAGIDRPNAQSCRVAQVIDELLEQFASALERKGIAVEWRPEGDALMVEAGEDIVAQVLGNLISNVEKYAASGGLLKLDARTEAEEIVVRVSDRGPGINESQRERIFQAFQRIDDRVSEGSSGTGLGLGIARELAESHGGSLCLIDSGRSDGSIFELRLPIADEPIKVIDFPDAQAS